MYVRILTLKTSVCVCLYVCRCIFIIILNNYGTYLEKKTRATDWAAARRVEGAQNLIKNLLLFFVALYVCMYVCIRSPLYTRVQYIDDWLVDLVVPVWRWFTRACA